MCEPHDPILKALYEATREARRARAREDAAPRAHKSVPIKSSWRARGRPLSYGLCCHLSKNLQ